MSLRALDWRGNQVDRIVPGGGGAQHRCWLGRNAIYHGIEALGLKPGDRILIPAYICRAAVAPILARGLGVDFYRVGLRCDVDLDDAEARIGWATRALLIVHYFGFPQEMEGIAALCRRRGLRLIEDCAHVFGGEVDGRRLGTHGDISIFSWRKFLPVPDGGELVIRGQRPFAPQWEREGVLRTVRVGKSVIDQLVGSDRRRWRRWGRGVQAAAKAGRAVMSWSPAWRAMSQAEGGEEEFDLELANLRMSRLSRGLMTYSRAGWIIDRRRGNYQYLERELAELPAVRSLYDKLRAGVCPWVYPLFVGEKPNAHVRLRALGIPAVTWGGVRPDGVGEREHQDAHYLYDHLVFLPVHQDLERGDLEAVVAAVRAVASGPAGPP